MSREIVCVTGNAVDDKILVYVDGQLQKELNGFKIFPIFTPIFIEGLQLGFLLNNEDSTVIQWELSVINEAPSLFEWDKGYTSLNYVTEYIRLYDIHYTTSSILT